MRSLSCALVAILALGGCTTITASKTLVVTPEPGETRIAVTANAVSHCQDYFLFFRCTLKVDLERAR